MAAATTFYRGTPRFFYLLTPKIMSNEYNSQENEQYAVNTDEENVDEQSNQSEESEETTETQEDEKQKHKEKVWQGMIDAETLKVIKGEKTLEDVQPGLKEEVQKFLPEDKKEPQDDVVNKVKQELQLDNLVSSIDEEKQDEAKLDYQAFVSGGRTHEQAVSKIRQMYNVKTEQEAMAYGQRSHKPGGAQPVKGKTRVSQAEYKFLQRMGQDMSQYIT